MQIGSIHTFSNPRAHRAFCSCSRPRGPPRTCTEGLNLPAPTVTNRQLVPRGANSPLPQLKLPRLKVRPEKAALLFSVPSTDISRGVLPVPSRACVQDMFTDARRVLTFKLSLGLRRSLVENLSLFPHQLRGTRYSRPRRQSPMLRPSPQSAGTERQVVRSRGWNLSRELVPLEKQPKNAPGVPSAECGRHEKPAVHSREDGPQATPTSQVS